MITFEPLVLYLHQNKIKKTEFGEQVGISSSTQAKIFKDEYVELEVIEKICRTYNLKIEEVIKYVNPSKE